MPRKPNINIIEIGTPGWKKALPVVQFVDNKNILVDENLITIANTKNDPWNYEVHEQYLTNKWILKDDIVLELGSRLGIVSLTINSRLENKQNHIVIEPNKQVIKALKYNRKSFNAKFKICSKVISNKPLKYITLNNGLGNYTVNQDTIIDSDNMIEHEIKTISSSDFCNKYTLNYTVLVADCEGCLCTFLNENSYLFEKLELIIFERDNTEICNYKIVFGLLKDNGFSFRDGLINNSDNPELYFQQVWSK